MTDLIGIALIAVATIAIFVCCFFSCKKDLAKDPLNTISDAVIIYGTLVAGLLFIMGVMFFTTPV